MELTTWLQMLALCTITQRSAENPNAFGYACFRSPAVSPATPQEPDSDSPRTHPGPSRSPPPWPAYNPTDQHQPVTTNRKGQPHPGPWNPAATR
jgi:hypothetical protein